MPVGSTVRVHVAEPLMSKSALRRPTGCATRLVTWKLVPSSVPAPDAPPSATQRTDCLPRANHQHLVTAFHLAGCKYWSVGRDLGAGAVGLILGEVLTEYLS